MFASVLCMNVSDDLSGWFSHRWLESTSLGIIFLCRLPNNRLPKQGINHLADEQNALNPLQPQFIIKLLCSENYWKDVHMSAKYRVSTDISDDKFQCYDIVHLIIVMFVFLYFLPQTIRRKAAKHQRENEFKYVCFILLKPSLIRWHNCHCIVNQTQSTI